MTAPSSNTNDYTEIKPLDIVNEIIPKAFNMNASDIHIEPLEQIARISFRIDGILYEIQTFPMAYLEAVISSLKVMAELDLTEHRKPQDGHILFRIPMAIKSQSIDLRLSIFPTVLGEAAVMRILNRKDMLFEQLENLGIDSANTEKLKGILSQHSGMVLATGPGGSGKTTTLYSMLNHLAFEKSMRRNIVTLEDPVELRIENVRQSQIHQEIGFDFVTGLRSILRQDADVIMIGEIRDDETGRMALRAALTGALFFSTLHTTNSVGAIVRFAELGMPRSLIASAIRVIIAQRLLRTICPDCKVETNPSKLLKDLCGVPKDAQLRFFQGQGCDHCAGTGYLGRTGIFEILFVDSAIQNLIIEGAPFMEIEARARQNGMKTLRESGLAKVEEQITTHEEILRMI